MAANDAADMSHGTAMALKRAHHILVASCAKHTHLHAGLQHNVGLRVIKLATMPMSLAEMWKLPEQVCVVLEHHHFEVNGKPHSVAAVVALSLPGDLT